MFTKKYFKKITYENLFLFCLLFLIYGIFCSKKGSINPIDPIQEKMLFFSSFSVSEGELNIGDKIEIQASLINGKGEKIVGKKVMFFSSSAVGSYITEYGYTDTSGIAAAQYTTGKNSGLDTIIARVYDAENRTVSDSVFVKINMFGELKLSSAEQIIYADGIAGTEITAELRDIDQNAISGKTINFSANVGEIEISKITDNFGIAKVSFTGVASSKDITSVITASIESDALAKNTEEQTAKSLIADTLNILLYGITLNLTPSSSSIFSDGVSKTTIAAKLTTTSGIALSSKTISFTTNMGSLNSSEAITDSAGVAKITITSSTEIGQATITASYETEISGSTYVNFIEVCLEEPAFIELNADPAALSVSEGQSTITVVAIVTDENGNAVADGTLVNFSISPLVGIINSPAATVDGTTTTTLKYLSDKIGTQITILAQSGSVSDTVSLILPGISGDINEIQVFPADENMDKILADGIEQLEIAALLLDSDGKPVPNAIVNFEIENKLGKITKASISEVLTDTSDIANPNAGKAFATLTSIADTVDRFPIIKAISNGIEGLSEEGSIVFLGIELKVSAEKDTVMVGEQVKINVSLKEKTSNIAIDGSEITYGASLGSISKNSYTNSAGITSNILSAGDTPGTSRITVNYGRTVTKKMYVEIKASD